MRSIAAETESVKQAMYLGEQVRQNAGERSGKVGQ
jgi:hypothetical protein